MKFLAKPSIFLVIFGAIFLSGCGWVNEAVAHTNGWVEVCVRNVLYYQFPSGVTIAVDKTGKPVECK